jgi:hypothetical protein
MFLGCQVVCRRSNSFFRCDAWTVERERKDCAGRHNSPLLADGKEDVNFCISEAGGAVSSALLPALEGMWGKKNRLATHQALAG